MKNILLFGAGKSASVLIEYLLDNAAENSWRLTVADADKALIEQKTKNHPAASAVAVDISDDQKRKTLVVESDLVISMMPASLHILIAKDCLEYSKHLLTASYADDAIRALGDSVKAKGIIFLCEMGLDPGIDHMSAMKLVNDIKEKNGRITSFKSHCGGLVAPESDDNPWHYKISWNPRNIVLAGKAGAEYLEDGHLITEQYGSLFNPDRAIETGDDSIGSLSYYPNRNSLSYIDLYDLHDAKTFMRTTLRYRDFMVGWKKVIALKLTDETPAYESDGLSLAAFFQEHMDKYGFTEELMKEIEENKLLTKSLLKVLADTLGPTADPDNMIVDEEGNLITNEEDGFKNPSLKELTTHTHDANKMMQQLYFLGLDDETSMINKGLISAADGLQFALENKLALAPADKDMIVMQHEVEYMIDDERHAVTSSLIVKGKDNVHTAMAKTVGLPLGIAARLILNGTINLSGVHLPVIAEIYNPVLKELHAAGIRFNETKRL